jgi:hypothetical protein
MSAFIVSNKHIDTLVSYAMSSGIHQVYHNGDTCHLDGEGMGMILAEQNARSVNARYREQTTVDYSWTPIYRLPTNAVQILKACNCYDYQACETDDYDTTLAHAIIQAIQSKAIRSLPGYDAAEWEIN